jgi:hypothetical protein
MAITWLPNRELNMQHRRITAHDTIGFAEVNKNVASICRSSGAWSVAKGLKYSGKDTQAVDDAAVRDGLNGKSVLALENPAANACTLK